MYRIELTPGEEALFRNIEEFAKGIHSGVIGSHARIWHGASNKWLPIDFHPHYKIAKERPVTPPAPTPIVVPAEPKAAVSPFAPPAAPAAPAPAPEAAAPVAPAPTPVSAAPLAPAPKPVAKTRELQFIEIGPQAPAGIPASAALFEAPAQAATPRHIEALVAMAEQHPAPVVEVHEEVLIDISSPRRKFNPRLAGIAAGVLLAAAAGGALLARGSAEAPAEETDLAVASTSLAATPNQGFEIIPAPAQPEVAFRGNRAAEPVPTPVPVKDSTPAPAPVMPSAPTLSVAALRVGSADIGGIQDDRAELEGKLRATGFSNLLAESRLVAGSVGTTRLAVAGAAGLVRTYRAKATIDETDSGARMADALLADLDAALAILAGQEGGYEISGGTITFRDSARARDYTTIRNRIGGRIATAANSGSPFAATLARSLGAGRLPVLATR